MPFVLEMNVASSTDRCCLCALVGDVTLPADVRVPSLGPKFTVAPRESRLEQLSHIGQVVHYASADDSVRCLSEGVLNCCHNLASGPPSRGVASFLRSHSLHVLLASLLYLVKHLYLSRGW